MCWNKDELNLAKQKRTKTKYKEDAGVTKTTSKEIKLKLTKTHRVVKKVNNAKKIEEK